MERLKTEIKIRAGVEYNHIPDVILKIETGIPESVAFAAGVLLSWAQFFVPIAGPWEDAEPGALHDSLQAVQEGPNWWRVEAEFLVPNELNRGRYYAWYVEFGTRFMAAEPYMTPAAEMTRELFDGLVGGVLKDAVTSSSHT